MCKQVHQLIECMRLRSHVYHITYFTTMASDVDIFMHSYDMHSSSRDRHETTNASRCLLAIAVQILTMPSHSVIDLFHFDIAHSWFYFLGQHSPFYFLFLVNYQPSLKIPLSKISFFEVVWLSIHP